jgi:hypothetical protein
MKSMRHCFSRPANVEVFALVKSAVFAQPSAVFERFNRTVFGDGAISSGTTFSASSTLCPRAKEN